MKAVGYLRVSGISQADSSKDGLPRQQAAITAFAEAKGIELVRFYSDDGVSGTKEIEDRPALFELRADLMAGDVRLVIVESVSRLARDLLVSETILADFKKQGIEVLSTTEPDLASNEPSRKFVRQILSAVAELDRATIVARMKHGRDHARASGKRYAGRFPYGHRPGETAVIDRVHHLRRQGWNAAKIAALLNEEGYKTRKGTRFFPMQVARILSKYTR